MNFIELQDKILLDFANYKMNNYENKCFTESDAIDYAIMYSNAKNDSEVADAIYKAVVDFYNSLLNFYIENKDLYSTEELLCVYKFSNSSNEKDIILKVLGLKDFNLDNLIFL